MFPLPLPSLTHGGYYQTAALEERWPFSAQRPDPQQEGRRRRICNQLSSLNCSAGCQTSNSYLSSPVTQCWQQMAAEWGRGVRGGSWYKQLSVERGKVCVGWGLFDEILVSIVSIPDMICVFAQVVVPGTTTTALLQQLLPDTDYNVGVVALYSDGEGPSVSDEGKTCKNLTYCIFKDRPKEAKRILILLISYCVYMY